MTKIKDGGPAFPLGSVEHIDGVHYAEAGMTLRDYFAAKALPIIRSQNVASGERRFSETAREAYSMADAMLAAREVKL